VLMNPALQLQFPAAEGEYELMPHLLHRPPGREKLPGGQASQLILAATEENPAAHIWHKLFETDDLYLPGVHALHALPLCWYPMLQRHCVQFVLAVGDWAWRGHKRHEPADVAPCHGEYVPLRHSRQDSSVGLPLVAEYLPAVQSTQVPGAVAPADSEYLPEAQGKQTATEVAPVHTHRQSQLIFQGDVVMGFPDLSHEQFAAVHGAMAEVTFEGKLVSAADEAFVRLSPPDWLATGLIT
jgi:hypothetical protein